jgi:D-psicose/D-tagatose/L-ribulose 3-epimerase
MKFGMNLLLWTTDPTDEKWLPLFERLKGFGFDGVELPVFNPDVARWKALAKRLDAIGLARTAVTVRGKADDPISPDAAVRQAAVAANQGVLACCEAVGATILAGPYYAALGEFSGKGPTADEWKRSVEVMRATAEAAQRHRVTLVPEFLNRFEIYLINCVADMVRYVRDVGHPACRMMYDTFHAHIEEKDSAAAIRAGGKDIAHVHISENDRSTPGTGQVAWDATFDALRAINYDGWLTIEAFGLALPELTAATKIWRRMYVDEDQLARDGLKFMKAAWAKRAGASTAKR